ncbi:MAG: hypothetical protein ACTHOO_10950 [Alcanivorax sp.]
MTGKPHYDPAIWAEREGASFLTEVSLSNYAAHRRIILRKLELTQKAVLIHEKRKALSAGNNIIEKAKIWLFFGPSKSRLYQMWGQLLNAFVSKTVFENDLYDINKLLDLVPIQIKVVLSQCVDSDQKYQRLASEFNEAEYLEAKERIDSIQQHQNPLTGLSKDEYLCHSDLLKQLQALMFEEY